MCNGSWGIAFKTYKISTSIYARQLIPPYNEWKRGTRIDGKGVDEEMEGKGDGTADWRSSENNRMNWGWFYS